MLLHIFLLPNNSPAVVVNCEATQNVNKHSTEREVNSGALLPAPNNGCFKYVLGLNFFTNDGLWGKYETKEMVLKNLLSYGEDMHTSCVSDYSDDLR